MTSEGKGRSKFVSIATSAIFLLFCFYSIGVIRVLDFFPDQAGNGSASASTKARVTFSVAENFDTLLIWAGASISIIGICIFLVGLAIIRFSELNGWIRKYSFIIVGIITVAAAIALFTEGSEIAETAIAPDCTNSSEARSLCDIVGQDAEGRIANLNKPGWEFFYDHHNDKENNAIAIIRIKFLLNFTMQTAGVFLLSLSIILSTTRRIFIFIPISRIREAYFLSALLLSLVILSDALFYDFLSDATQDTTHNEKSEYLSAQRGLLFYYAIVSSTTLGLALAFCSLIGNVPLMLSSEGNEEKISISTLDKFRNFLLNPSFATAFATIAPILIASWQSSSP